MMSEGIVKKSGPVDTNRTPHAVWRTLPLGAVRLRAGFWSGRQSLNRNVSLRHGFEMLEKAGNFDNLRIAAGRRQGKFRGRNFYDEDVYKWLEALGWELGLAPDAELQKMADEVIELISAAQRPDGYLNSYYQVAEPDNRWTDMDFGHELYCAGHLIQAAVAFQRALGDSRLLDVACRFADHICSTFGPGKRSWAPGHPEIEMALIELYRETGRTRYLEMSEYFVDERGKRRMAGLGSSGPEYHQDHIPVRQVQEATGHAVRQLYLTTGVTDLYMETGEPALLDAMDRLWRDVVGSKMYITGGVGSRYDGESFGEPYELPTDTCYCETCAGIANLMWNWRMLLVSGDGKYADTIERTLYNTVLSSPGLDGKHYFYVNPLMVRASRYLRMSDSSPAETNLDHRPEWHYVACCPPNVMRLLSSLAHYYATTDQKGIQIHLYGPAELALESDGHPIALRMETEFPWQGRVHVEIKETADAPWALRLRMPEWCHQPSLYLNGKVVSPLIVEKGYVALDRVWRVGDIVELNLDMPPLLVESNPRVDATRNCLAIQRGPIVYCLEDQDQEVRDRLLDIQIDASAAPEAHWQRDLLGGVMVVQTMGYVLELQGTEGELYSATRPSTHPSRRSVRLTAIPYYAWGNRGLGPMRVWIPRA